MTSPNYIRHLNAFFSFVRNDQRLTCSHVSLYLALFQYWNLARFQNPFPIYRQNILQISKIGSKNTYHKCIRELHQARYICYHPAPSRFQPVKISIIRLDLPREVTPFHQLDLFQSTNDVPEPAPLRFYGNPSADPHPATGDAVWAKATCPTPGTAAVPVSAPASIESSTGAVPKRRHSLNQTCIKQENGVQHPPTISLEKERGKNGNAARPHEQARTGKQRTEASGSTQLPVQGLNRKGPALSDVEDFFRSCRYPVAEARKFFYYNCGKSWMLTAKLPITNWPALAHKWMLNAGSERQQAVDIDGSIQYLYERYLEGVRINKFLLPEFAEHLGLQVTDTILKEAVQRRINQLSGSNEASENRLWQAYMTEQWECDILVRDKPNLIALASRLAVLQYFQKCKATGITSIIPQSP